MEKRKHISTTAAAADLGVTDRTIIRYCQAGVFPNAYILDPTAKRSVWVIPPEDISEYKKGHPSKQPYK